MSQTKEIVALTAVKQKLAEKYENLSRVTPSRPRAKKMMIQAKKYRRQVELLKMM